MKQKSFLLYCVVYATKNVIDKALASASLCTCVLWWQEMEIIMEDGNSEMRPQEQYHFAMSGKSFAVIIEHFQDLLQKVGWKHICFLYHIYTRVS